MHGAWAHSPDCCAGPVQPVAATAGASLRRAIVGAAAAGACVAAGLFAAAGCIFLVHRRRVQQPTAATLFQGRCEASDKVRSAPHGRLPWRCLPDSPHEATTAAPTDTLPQLL